MRFVELKGANVAFLGMSQRIEPGEERRDGGRDGSDEDEDDNWPLRSHHIGTWHTCSYSILLDTRVRFTVMYFRSILFSEK